jgi:cytoskeletal protein RodZ
MPGFGQQLTAAREARGMTAADVAKRLRIRAMFVDALEREDWNAVGEPVYARGFLKNYARLVGLDPESAAAAHDEAYPAHTPRLPDVPALTRDETSISGYAPAHSGGTNWLVVATGVIATVMLIAVGWNFFGMQHAGPATETVLQSSPPPSPSAAAMIDGSASAAAPAQTQGVDLRLETTQACWLSVTVDGKRVVYDTLPKGAVREFHAAREITLRAGNAGGIVATIDGKPLGTLGQVGQVQDRVFAVASPAPSRTATP